MFSVEIMGGLGNQLFQIFTAMAYSIRFKKKLFISKYKYDFKKRPPYWDNFLNILTPILVDKTISLPQYNEKGFHYEEIPHITNTSFKLYGYFQSYKYFEDYSETICDLLKIKNWQKKVKTNNSIDYKNTISLHFRIGDYKPIQEHHPMMPVGYYIKALETIIKETRRDNWNVLYFYQQSDDEDVNNNIGEIKQVYKNINFVPVDHKLLDYEQMLLMSLCEHNIIANSSFSWWGAYFNTNKDKIVCRPNIWFGPAMNIPHINDMSPPSWREIIV